MAKELVPSVIGNVANVRPGSVNIPHPQTFDFDTIGKGMNALSGVLYDNYKEQQLKERDSQQTRTQQLLNAANRELDEFINNDIFKRQGLNADGSARIFGNKYDEIKEKYRAQVDGKLLDKFDAMLDSQFNSRMNGVERYQNQQLDSAARSANAAGIDHAVSFAIVNPNDDSSFALLETYFDDALRRKGYGANLEDLAIYEQAVGMKFDKPLALSEKIMAAETELSAAEKAWKSDNSRENRKRLDNAAYYKTLVNAVKEREDLRQLAIDRIQQGRIDNYIAAKDVESAGKLMEMCKPTGSDPYPYKMSDALWKKMNQKVNADAKLRYIQSEAYNLMQRARAKISGGESFADVEMAVLDVVRQNYQGDEQEKILSQVKTQLGEFERYHKARKQQTMRDLVREQEGKNYSDARLEVESTLNRNGADADSREATLKLLDLSFGKGDADHPVTRRAMDGVMEDLALGSYVVGEVEYPINSLQDLKECYTQKWGAPWSEQARTAGLRALSMRDKVVPKATLDKIVASKYKGKTAIDFPGLREYVQAGLPIDRPAPYDQIERLATQYLVMEATGDGWFRDYPSTLGELQGDLDRTKMKPEQMAAMFRQEIHNRERARLPVPSWMKEGIVAGKDIRMATLKRYAQMRGFRYQGAFGDDKSGWFLLDSLFNVNDNNIIIEENGDDE